MYMIGYAYQCVGLTGYIGPISLTVILTPSPLVFQGRI